MLPVDFRREDPAIRRHRRFPIVKKTLVLSFLFLALAGFALSVTADDADVLGVWATAPTDKGQAHVKITEDGGAYFGQIIWLEKATFDDSEGPELAGKEKTDRQNPKKSMRSEPIVGLQIVKNMKPKGDGSWDGGTIYDPENGKTYKAKMSLDGDTLKVRGFIGFSLLGRTSEWKRVKE